MFVQFLSHKILRLLVPFVLVLLLISNLALSEGWFGYLLVAQLIFYAGALSGWGLKRIGVHERWTSLAFSFCLLNLAALVGAIRFVKKDTALWTRTSE